MDGRKGAWIFMTVWCRTAGREATEPSEIAWYNKGWHLPSRWAHIKPLCARLISSAAHAHMLHWLGHKEEKSNFTAAKCLNAKHSKEAARIPHFTCCCHTPCFSFQWYGPPEGCQRAPAKISTSAFATVSWHHWNLQLLNSISERCLQTAQNHRTES